jgi:hypothetical protein
MELGTLGSGAAHGFESIRVGMGNPSKLIKMSHFPQWVYAPGIGAFPLFYYNYQPVFSNRLQSSAFRP